MSALLDSVSGLYSIESDLAHLPADEDNMRIVRSRY